MRAIKHVSLALAVVMLIAALAGCTSQPQPAPAQAPAQPNTAPSSQQSSSQSSDAQPPADVPDTIQVGIQYDVSSFDPQMIGGMTSMSVNINIFDMLVFRDEDGKLCPSIATDWYTIDDVTWQFKIREDAYFTNGEQVNAEAVKFSFDRLINPDTKSPIVELAEVASIDVVDEFTVNIVTNAPDPILPNKTALFGGVILPPKYYSENTPEFLAKNPVGSGPYKFVKWEKDSYVELVANEDHWRGAPAVKRVIFRIIPDLASLMAALKTGEVDLVQKVSPDLATQFENDEAFTIIKADAITTTYICIDPSVAPFDKVEVRQALNYAIDRQTIVDTLYSGAAKLNATLLPKRVFGHDESIEPYPYDPAKAKELLAAAGYPNGFEFNFSADEAQIVAIQAICSYLEAVGIKANLNMMSNATLTTNLTEGKVDPIYLLSNTGWTMDGFNYVQTFVHSGRRHCRINDPELDALVIKEEQNTDSAVRLEAFSEMQKLLMERAYFVGLWQADNIVVVNSDFDFTPNEIGILWMYTAKPAAN